jgi:periplasmic protein TonB
MQTSLTASSGTVPAAPSGMRARVISTVAVVALVHIALIATIMRMTERTSKPDAIESPVITAQLLSQEPAPARAATAPIASPPPVQPAPRPVVRKKVEPHVAPPHVSPAPRPVPAPTPAPSQAGAPNSAPAPEAADAQSAKTSQEASAETAAAAPASGRETLAISAPKSVPHIDCQIVKPDYPALSKRRGETGTANVRFVVGTTGTIESVTLAKSSGYPRLDDAALAAMRESSCRPYVESGTPMRVTYTQPFGFTLDD